jgi:hypothetical protein
MNVAAMKSAPVYQRVEKVCRAFRFSAGRENCSPGSFYA